MDIKKFVLSYYKNATNNFYISEITAPTEALKLHTHDYFQVYYLLSGKLTHHIESGYAELSCGDVFIVPPNLPHYIAVNDDPVIFTPCPLCLNFLSVQVTATNLSPTFYII